jgi:hypothetical protein
LSPPSPKLLDWAVGAIVVAVVYGVVAEHVPEEGGWLNGDFAYFLPHMLSTAYARSVQGPFAVVWFTPSFCGGLPALANAQDTQWMIPQWLFEWLGPGPSVRIDTALLAGIAFAGTLRLLRRSFALPIWPAIVGATVFATHGAFVFRMMAGQLAYHSVVLVPLVASFVVRRPPGTLVFDAAAAGVLLGYMALSGNLTFLVPVGVALTALGLLDTLERGSFAWLGRLAAAVGVSIALALFKLVAVAAFMSSFPRDLYAVPAMDSLLATVWLALTSLVGHGFELAAHGIVNPNWWSIGEVDYEMGITPVGLALAFWGAALVAAGAARERRWVALVLLAAVLALPLLFNWRASADLLKAIPVLKSTSSFVRWLWIYVPIAVVLGARALASVAIQKQLGPVLVPLVLLSLLLEDKGGYRERVYHEAPVAEAWRALRETGSPPAIETVATAIVAGVRRDDALVAGASAFPCYEPTFGYGLEGYPATRLAAAPATEAIDGAFNFVDPRCMVWPHSIGCAPGDRFALADRAALDDFLAYRNLPVDLPPAQRAANVVSGIAWIAAGAALAFSARFRSAAGRRAGSDPGRAS